MVWNRAAATVQLIMLASSHPESIFALDCLELCKIPPQQVCRKLVTLSYGKAYK